MRLASVLATATCLLPLLGSVSAHMQMSEPFPIRSPLNPDLNFNNDIDYSYTSPLLADGSNFPCKGYQNDRPIVTTASYRAGEQYTMKFAGTATHGGGSCQISLSYDNGKTFRVIKSIIGGCPLTLQYQFTIPSYAPSGTALLAWTWYNHIGNREIYMDCAEVQIQGGSSASKKNHKKKGHNNNKSLQHGNQKVRRQSEFTSFDQLPFIWKANLPSVNDCGTVEGVDPVFPDPGPDVEYGAGLSETSNKSPGVCDRPTPYGPAYQPLDPEAKGGSPPPEPPTTPEPPSTPTGLFTPGLPQTMRDPNMHHHSIGTATPPLPITLPTIGSMPVAGSTMPMAPIPSSASIPTTLTSSPIFSTAQTTPLPIMTSTPISAMPSPSLPSLPSPSDVFTENLPCVPGTFLCTSRTTFAQCFTADEYITIGLVAAGMRCQPFLAAGYRNDKIVRAAPLGVCTPSVDGTQTVKCLRGGSGFAVCNEGSWFDMGAVTQGLECVPGQGIVLAPP